MQETKQIGKGILSGLMAIFIVMIVTSLLVSLMLTFTSMQESSFKWMIMILSFVALLLGGSFLEERQRSAAGSLVRLLR